MLRSAALLSALLFADSAAVLALDNGLERTPILGWTSQGFGRNIDEALVRRQAAVLVNSGMAQAGYRHVLIHEGWSVGTDQKGRVVADRTKFPNIAKLFKDLKRMGLTTGLYITAGQGGFGPADLQRNINILCRDWGVEVLSVANVRDENTGRAIAAAVRKTGKKVLIEIVSGGFPGPWIASVANHWTLYPPPLLVNYFDLTRHKYDDCIEPVSDPAKSITRERAKYAGPGHFYSIGDLPVGQGMSTIRDQAVLSLNYMLACPTMIAIDLTRMSAETRALFLNAEAIAINQDSLGAPGVAAKYYDPWHCAYRKPLADGSVAFLLVNRCHYDKVATITHQDLGVDAATPFEIYDVWTHTRVGTFKGTFSINVMTSDKDAGPSSYLYKIAVRGEGGH